MDLRAERGKERHLGETGARGRIGLVVEKVEEDVAPVIEIHNLEVRLPGRSPFPEVPAQPGIQPGVIGIASLVARAGDRLVQRLVERMPRRVVATMLPLPYERRIWQGRAVSP